MTDLYGTGTYVNNIYGVADNTHSSEFIRSRNDYDYNGSYGDDYDDDEIDIEWV